MPAAGARLNPVSVTDLLLLGAWLGIAYGILEAVEVVLLGALPGLLSWRTGNSAHILWFAPIFYGAVGVVASAPFLVLRRWTGLRLLDRAMVFIYVSVGAWLGATVPPAVIAEWALVILALGIGTQGMRLYVRWSGHVVPLARRSFPVLIALVAVMWIGVHGIGALRERAAMSALPTPPVGAPNVLLLVMDTERADHLSTYGYDRETTPRIDRLASQSVVYRRAYSPSSWTLPSHASMFTGLTPQEHRAGVIHRPYLDGTAPTLAEILRDRGYATGGFVANEFWCGRQTRLDRGFIRYEDFYQNAADAMARTSLGRHLAYGVLPWFGLTDVPGRKNAAKVNEQFLHWLDGLGGRPFFAFLNYFDVHGPLLPKPPYAGRFSKGDVRPQTHEIQIGALTGDIPEVPEAERRAQLDAYDESLLYLDAQIGTLLDTLARRGVLEHTVVVLTSDHGESFGEHGMMFHGHSMYVDQIDVPLMIRYPARVPEATTIASPVGTERIGATILSMIGAPAGALPGVPLPLRAGEADSVQAVVGGVARRSLVPANWPTSRGWVTSVFTARWHYLLYEDGSAQLFAADDHAEVTDLARSPAFADTVAAFGRRFGAEWQQSVSARRAGGGAAAVERERGDVAIARRSAVRAAVSGDVVAPRPVLP